MTNLELETPSFEIKPSTSEEATEKEEIPSKETSKETSEESKEQTKESTTESEEKTKEKESTTKEEIKKEKTEKVDEPIKKMAAKSGSISRLFRARFHFNTAESVRRAITRSRCQGARVGVK